jgi:hypothetical protein
MNVNIETTVAPNTFPAGTDLGQMRFRLSKGGAPWYTLFVDVPLPPVVTFVNVAAGEYTLSIQRLTTGSVPTGPAYTANVSVAEQPPVVGDVPTGASVTVA